MASLIDNTFENQSAIEDENNGGALADATGGTSAAGATSSASKFSLDSAKNAIMSALSFKPGGTLFKNGKFVFPSNLLSNLKLDSLLSSIKSALASGLSISDALKNCLNNLLSTVLSQLKNSASDTWSFLQSASGAFKDTLLDKLKGVLLSRIYVPDVVFLAGLYPLKAVHSNIKYKNSYVRNICIKHDMPLSLAFVDEEEGIRYTNENTKGTSDAVKAARYGSFNVSLYIMDKLYDEIKELRDCYPLPKDYDRDQQETMRSNYKNVIDETQEKIDAMIALYNGNETAITALKLTPVYKTLEDKLNEYQEMYDSLAINKEDKYMEDSSYKKIQTLINTGMKNIYKITKAIIVNSYSNFTSKELLEIINKYGLRASEFGSKDTNYGKAFKISSSDLNIMAPIIKPSSSKSVMSQYESISKSSSLIPDVEVKFISPRNVNVKSLYITLASKAINEHYMTNKEFYERMKYPVYSTLIEAADSALSGLFNVGIGKDIVGTLNSIEEGYYQYAKNLEPYLYNASKIEYISYNDLSVLPTPDEEEIKNNSKQKSSSSGRKDSKSNSNSKASKCAGGTTASTDISKTYDNFVNNIEESDIRKILNEYDSENDSTAIANMTEAQLRARLIYLLKNDKINLDDILSHDPQLLSLTSFKRYYSYLYPDVDLSDSSVYTYKFFYSFIRKQMMKSILDLDSKPSTYMTTDDMKRYVRKYYGYKESSLVKQTDNYVRSIFDKRIKSSKRYIYYTKEVEFCGFDGQGFPIIGYPDSDTITNAISNNNIGTYSEANPNGYPVNSSGYPCPIIGYNSKGKAMYGTPVFYPDIDPISKETRILANNQTIELPVFAYYKDTAILDDSNITEVEINNNITKNENKIAELNKYIKNGASGVLKKSYENQINSMTNINKIYSNMLSYVFAKPVISYNENGDINLGTIDLLHTLKSPDGYNCIGYDVGGNLIYEYTEEAKSIIGYDSNGSNVYGSSLINPFGYDKDDHLIYGYDEEYNPIYGFTKDGESVIEITYSASGEVTDYKIGSDIKQYIGITSENNPIFDYDQFGNPIIGYDKNKNAILFIEKDKLESYYEDYKTKLINSENEYQTYRSKIFNEAIYDFKDIKFIDSELYFITSDNKEVKYDDIKISYASLVIELNDQKTKDSDNYNTAYEKLIIDINYKVKEYAIDVSNIYCGKERIKPIIGMNDYIPILGENIIESSVDLSVPELAVISETYEISSDAETSDETVLDKTDIDIDADFAAAEQEIISNSNGITNIGRVLTIIYGITETETI